MIEIPKHNCRNCGDCCGPIAATKKELKLMKEYLAKNISQKVRSRIKKQKRNFLTCQFRDTEEKKCIIYPVRPEVCKLFGVVDVLRCPYGNSADLDGRLIELNGYERHYSVPSLL